MRLLLDTNVLGKICHPRKHQEVRAWFRAASFWHEMLLPEIADYELRRELLRIDAKRSLARLDELTREIHYIPVTTAIFRDAAQLWAKLRRAGRVTAPEEGLDADMILAAQALAEGATVVTSNVRHLALVVPAMDWGNVPTG